MTKTNLNLNYTSYNVKDNKYKSYQERFLELAKDDFKELAYCLEDKKISEIYNEAILKLKERKISSEKTILEKLKKNGENLTLSTKMKSILMVIMEENMEKIFDVLELINKESTTSLSVSILHSEDKKCVGIKIIDDNVKVEELLSIDFPESMLETNYYLSLITFYLLIVHLVDTVANNPFNYFKKDSSDVPTGIL